MTVAFDVIDHEILLNGLESWIGLSVTTLSWFNTYLTDRNYSVSLGDYVSQKHYGVPQGSILGPLLFSLYMIPLGEIIRNHRIHFHCYADDTQLYLSVAPDNKDALHPLLNCFSSIVQWMNGNFLKLNVSHAGVCW